MCAGAAVTTNARSGCLVLRRTGVRRLQSALPLRRDRAGGLRRCADESIRVGPGGGAELGQMVPEPENSKQGGNDCLVGLIGHGHQRKPLLLELGRSGASGV